MAANSIKLESSKLQLGMYIDHLDRPWLETPFLFQGFEIRNDRELRQLREYCEHVYVDAGRGSVPRDQILSAAARRFGVRTVSCRTKVSAARRRNALRRLLAALARRLRRKPAAAEPEGEDVQSNTRTVMEEAPEAARAYDSAVASINDVLDNLRQGRDLDSRQMREAVTPVVESLLRSQDAMVWLIFLRKRDQYSYHHSVATAAWAVILGRHLGFARSALDDLAMGGALLDVGKTKLPADLFDKEGCLTEAEQKLMQRHVEFGLEMAAASPAISPDVLTMIEGHHERADGSGYPRGITSKDIPMVGQIAGLVDCFDAMTTRRPYAAPRSPYDAIRELLSLGDKMFQRELVEHFVQAVGMFPTGTLLELSTGLVGIVVEQNRIRRLRPKIMILLDGNKQPVSNQDILDLSVLPSEEREPGAIWITRGLEVGAYELDPKDYFM